jgi:hypothetical protein
MAHRPDKSACVLASGGTQDRAGAAVLGGRAGPALVSSQALHDDKTTVATLETEGEKNRRQMTALSAQLDTLNRNVLDQNRLLRELPALMAAAVSESVQAILDTLTEVPPPGGVFGESEVEGGGHGGFEEYVPGEAATGHDTDMSEEP